MFFYKGELICRRAVIEGVSIRPPGILIKLSQAFQKFLLFFFRINFFTHGINESGHTHILGTWRTGARYNNFHQFAYQSCLVFGEA